MKKSPKYELVEVPEAVSDLLCACETYCIADCCGTDAFELEDKLVQEWVRQVGVERAGETRRELDAFLTRVQHLKCDLACCPRVHLTGPPAEVASWFEVLSGLLDAAGVPQMVPPSAQRLPYPPATVPKAEITSTEPPAA